MSFLSRFGWSLWSLSNLEPPWGARLSIHEHVRAHLRDDAAGLAPGGDELPDEARVRGDSQFGWRPAPSMARSATTEAPRPSNKPSSRSSTPWER